MKLFVKYLAISILSILLSYTLCAQQMSTSTPAKKINISYNPFTMISGDREFSILQNKIPESLSFFFLRNSSIRWIENEIRHENQYQQRNQNIQIARSKSSKELDQLFVQDLNIEYVIEGSFSEFNGRLDIYVRLFEIKSKSHYDLNVITGSYDNIAELIKEAAVGIENKIKELNNKGALKNIGVICYQTKGLLRSKELNNLGDELAVSLSSKMQNNEYRSTIPYRQTRFYCKKAINEFEILEEINADAIVTGQINPVENNNITVESFIYIRGEQEPFYLNSITQKSYNYLGIEEQLIGMLNNLLNSMISQDGHWNIEFLKFESDNHSDYENEAKRYAELGENEIAIYLYHKALKLNKNLYQVYNNLAILKNKQEKFDEAVELAQYAIELNPGFSNSYLTLGNSFMKSGNYEMALDVFQRANRIESNNVDIQLNMGLTNLYLGKYNEAINNFESVHQLDPNNVEVDRYLGQAYSYLRNDETSKIYYERFMTNNPDDVSSGEELSYKYVKSGVKLFQQKDYEKALVDFKKAAEYSENELNYDNIRNTLNYLGDFQQADEYIHKGLRKSIYDSDIFRTQGDNLKTLFAEDVVKKEQYAFESIKNYEIYLESNPEIKYDVLGNMGLVYDYLGNDNQALHYYEEAYLDAQKLDKINEVFWVLNNLADYYYGKQNFEKSIKYNTEILEADRYYLISYLTLSDSYIVTGNIQEALIQLQKQTKLLNNKIVQRREYNQQRWWWPVDNEIVTLENFEMKKAYSNYKLAFAYFLNDKGNEALHQISVVKETDAISLELIERLIDKDLKYFLSINASYSAVINDFRRMCGI